MNAEQQNVQGIQRHLQNGDWYRYEGPQGVTLAIATRHPALGEWRYQLVSPLGGPAPPFGAVPGVGMLLSQMEAMGPLSEWEAVGGETGGG